MLKIKNINFGYGQNIVLKDFSLQVKKGEILALLGPSGSGKSTVLRLVAGLENPISGDIVLDGKSVVKLAPEKRRVGMVFQDYALFPHLNVRKNIAFALKNKKDPLVDQLLELTKMKGFDNRFPHELSGGEKQRVALARTLAHRPKFMLLDEPFSNLDQDLKKGMRREVLEILKSHSISAIIVTHDIEDAEAIASRIVRL